MWRLSGTVLLRSLQSLWLDADLNPEFAPEAPSDDVAFARAVRELSSPSVRAEKLTDGGWALVSKKQVADGAGADLRFGTELRVWMNADETLRAEPENDPRAEQIAANFTAFQRELSQLDISQWLVEQVERLNATSLRDTGGIYFLPNTALEEWGKIVTVLRGCSVHKIFSVPALATDEDTIALVLDAIAQESRTMFELLNKEIETSNLSSRALESRKNRLFWFEQKLQKYEELLGTRLDSVRENLTAVDQSISHALIAAEAARAENAK